MKFWLISLWGMLFVLLSISCHKEKVDSEDLLARVDEKPITLKDFRLYYELDPNFGIDSIGYGALLDELCKFIDQKLAYKKAQETGLTRDSLFLKAKHWEQKQAMLRQLYREKVEKQVEISEQELREAFMRYNAEVHVRHLFVKDIERAQELYHQLQNDASFKVLASQVFDDTVLAKSGGDLGWIKAGDLDEDFADAVLNLNKNEISQPVQTRWGYHIIQLLNRKDQVMTVESQFNAQRTGLEKRIKRHKSRLLSDEFIASFMKDLNPQPVSNNFHRLWNAIVPPPEREKHVLSFKIMLTNGLIREASKKLQSHLDEPLIQYQGGRITLGDYLNALKEIPVSNRPRFQSAVQLSNKIAAWIRDKLLFEEAKRESLDDHPRVREELEEFLEQQSYQYFLNEEIGLIDPPKWIKNYFENKDKKVLKDHPELSGCHTLQEWVWYEAGRNVHETLKSINADIEIDTVKLREENKSIDWDRRIRIFAIQK